MSQDLWVGKVNISNLNCADKVCIYIYILNFSGSFEVSINTKSAFSKLETYGFPYTQDVSGVKLIYSYDLPTL